MNKKVAVILLNCHGYAEKYLADCILSLRKQDYWGEIKIFIVDNGTSAESYNILSKDVPEAELILNKTNDGFAKGNNDAIKLALAQGFDYVFLLNLDTIIEPNCIRKLVEAIKQGDSRLRGNDNREIGCVQARLMLWPDKEKINSLGNSTHFLGFGFCGGYGQTLPPPLNLPLGQGEKYQPMKNRHIFYPSGAAVLLRTDVLKKIGLFDEKFWMYNEDQDLGWRIWLAGYKCVLASDAVVYHKYEFSRSITKYYWMDRNRILVVLKNYHWATLILIFPAFLIMELGLILFSIKTGWFKEKIQVWKFFFTPKNWIYVIRERREAQDLRKIKDRDIVPMISGKIWYQEIDDPKLRLINPIFNVYWKIVKAIIFW